MVRFQIFYFIVLSFFIVSVYYKNRECTASSIPLIALLSVTLYMIGFKKYSVFMVFAIIFLYELFTGSKDSALYILHHSLFAIAATLYLTIFYLTLMVVIIGINYSDAVYSIPIIDSMLFGSLTYQLLAKPEDTKDMTDKILLPKIGLSTLFIITGLFAIPFINECIQYFAQESGYTKYRYFHYFTYILFIFVSRCAYSFYRKIIQLTAEHEEIKDMKYTYNAMKDIYTELLTLEITSSIAKYDSDL